jgi:rare lipoprotein A
MRSVLCAMLVCLGLLAACAPVAQPVGNEVARQAALAVPTSAQGLGLPAEGMASWYGPGFAGRRTANGEVFDPSQLTAAHRSLPFGTQVRVTNLSNGRSVVVRINDRGPFARGRIIDLSRAAAERIGMIGSGTARVRLELLSVADSPLWAAAASALLQRYDIVSRFHERGELLYLSASGGGEPVLVRVIGNDIPDGVNADLLLSADLYARLGSRVYAAP